MVNNQPEESEANEFTLTPIFSNGSFPGPSGSVANYFQTTYNIPNQSQQATHLYGLLKEDALQPLDLNADTIPILALVNIPILSKVQLVFGVGFGLRIICAMPSIISNQYAMLSGEGGPDLGCPNFLNPSQQ